MRKLRLREIVCPGLSSWGKAKPGLKSKPGGFQSPGLFHDTTKLYEKGCRPRLGPRLVNFRQPTADWPCRGDPQTGALVLSPREQAVGNVPMGLHCHLVATWGHCTTLELHHQFYYGPGNKFIFLSRALRNAERGTGQFHLHVIQLSRHLLGPTLSWMPRQNRRVPI